MGGGKAEIEIFDFAREKINIENKDKSCLGSSRVAWGIGESLREAPSSYAVKIQALFRGVDAARFL